MSLSTTFVYASSLLYSLVSSPFSSPFCFQVCSFGCSFSSSSLVFSSFLSLWSWTSLSVSVWLSLSMGVLVLICLLQVSRNSSNSFLPRVLLSPFCRDLSFLLSYLLGLDFLSLNLLWMSSCPCWIILARFLSRIQFLRLTTLVLTRTWRVFLLAKQYSRWWSTRGSQGMELEARGATLNSLRLSILLLILTHQTSQIVPIWRTSLGQMIEELALPDCLGRDQMGLGRLQQATKQSSSSIHSIATSYFSIPKPHPSQQS